MINPPLSADDNGGPEGTTPLLLFAAVALLLFLPLLFTSTE